MSHCDCRYKCPECGELVEGEVIIVTKGTVVKEPIEGHESHSWYVTQDPTSSEYYCKVCHEFMEAGV